MVDQPGLGRREEAWRPGALVGRYRLVELLGTGGMGVVYRAIDVETGAAYALKSLAAEAPDLRARFRREAQAQAKVDRHPNVVRVHTAGEASGRPYFVMELADGDLQGRLKRGPLEPGEGARVVRDLAKGLAHLHAHGIIHRDLKPANVLFTDGIPKIVDFGLVRVDGAESLTKTGQIMGTPTHMSPEQARSEEADCRSDVYGLGATLYHCVTGRPPFVAQSLLRLLDKVAREPPPPPRELAPSVPPALERLCLKALSKSPDDRQQSADALVAELDEFLEGTAGQPIPIRAAAIGSVVVAAGVLAIGAYLTPSADWQASVSPAPRPTPALPPPTPTPTLPDVNPDDVGPDIESPALREALEQSVIEFPEGKADLLRSLKEGDPVGMSKFGRMLWAGTEVPAAPDLAVGWFRRAAKRGESKAAQCLARAYRIGRGVERNHELARKWFRFAAENGQPNAWYELSWVIEDPKELASVLELAAKSGDDAAPYEFGLACLRGDGVDRDPVRAFHWIVVAADRGHAGAEEYLASADSVTASEQEVRWLEEVYAAMSEPAKGKTLHTFGKRYQEHRAGRPRDIRMAIRCFTASAEAGDASAQRRLAGIHVTGQLDAPEDVSLGLFWMHCAVRTRDRRIEDLKGLRRFADHLANVGNERLALATLQILRFRRVPMRIDERIEALRIKGGPLFATEAEAVAALDAHFDALCRELGKSFPRAHGVWPERWERSD